MNKMQTDLAKIDNPHIHLVRGKWPQIAGRFHYENGNTQGLGYTVDREFLKKFIKAFGQTSLPACSDVVVRVTHTREKILKIEPLDNIENGEAFDIREWSDG